MCYREMGDIQASQKIQDKIIELAERRLEVDPESLVSLGRIAIAYAVIGKNNQAVKAIEKIKQIDPYDGVALYNCACTNALLNNKKEAFICFEAALKMGFMNIIDWVPGDPYLISIRNDPKFKMILNKYST